jgi:hypothetical protein
MPTTGPALPPSQSRISNPLWTSSLTPYVPCCVAWCVVVVLSCRGLSCGCTCLTPGVTAACLRVTRPTSWAAHAPLMQRDAATRTWTTPTACLCCTQMCCCLVSGALGVRRYSVAVTVAVAVRVCNPLNELLCSWQLTRCGGCIRVHSRRLPVSMMMI